MDYSIIGKEVNYASKLEQKAKPMNILISDSTYELIKDEILCIKKEPILKKEDSKLNDTFEVVKRINSRERETELEKKAWGI